MSSSFEEVFSQHYQSVYRLALSLAGNPADAEDIAQEAFVAIHAALPRFRGEAQIRTWIYRIAFRVGARWLAKRGTVAEFSEDQQAAESALPLDLIHALQTLPWEFRTVVLLVSIEGLSHDEAAEVLAIPTGTVASRLHYARKRLLAILAG